MLRITYRGVLANNSGDGSAVTVVQGFHSSVTIICTPRNIRVQQ